MKSLNKINPDYIVLAVSSAIIITFSALLYADFNRKIDAGDAKQIGTITFKRKVAQRKYQAQVVWEDIEQNAPVFNNDSIRTSDLSEAVINLGDGTSINLDESSMILLSTTGGGININFSHGSISANRSATTIGGRVAKINIKSKDTTVSIGEGDIKLSKTAKKELNVTVNKGTAEVKTEKGSQTVEKDQKIVITKDQETQIFKINLRLNSPGHNEYIVSAKGINTVPFSWQKVAGNARVFLEVSPSRYFRDGVRKIPVKTDRAVVKLPPGIHYWRLTARDQKTGKVELSDMRKLNIIKDAPVNIIVPLNRQTVTYSVKPPIIRFKWTDNKLASLYSVDISRDPEFNNMVRSIDTKLTGIAVDNLVKGTYYWRVRTAVNINVKSYSGSSPVYSFTVDKLAKVQPPVLVSPVNGQSISVSLLQNKKFLFSWKADSQFKQYLIVVDRDKNFSSPIVNKITGNNFFVLAKALPPDSYFWKVGAQKPGDKEILFSGPSVLKVMAFQKIQLAAPMVRASYKISKDKTLTSLQFRWSKSKIKGVFLFEMSRDPGFVTVMTRKVTNNNTIRLNKLQAGSYHWRVKLLDNNRNQITGSDVSTTHLAYNGKLVASADEVFPPKVVEKPVKKDDKKDVAKDDKKDDKKDIAKKDDIKKDDVKKDITPGATAVLTVSSSVRGGTIYINNNAVGINRAAYRPDPGEKINVVVKAKGYYDYRTNITLRKGERKNLYARLARLRKKKRVRWSADLPTAITAKPVMYNNIIIVTTKKGDVIGLNRNGRQIWKRRLMSPSQSTPAVHKGIMYIGTVNSMVYSINVNSGKVLWKKVINGPLLFGSEPIIKKNRVYLATSNGAIHAFTVNGKELWTKDLEEEIFSKMTYHDEVLYLGTDNSVVYALDTKDGDKIWDFKTDSRIFLSAPKVHGDTVYVGCYSGTLYALSTRRGKMKWSFNTGGKVFSAPVISGSAVFIGNEKGTIHALNISNGTVVWKYDTGSKIAFEPVIIKSNIYVTGKQTVFSLDLATGKLIWKEGFNNSIKTPPAMMRDSIVLGLDNGEVISLRTDLYF